MKLRFNLPTYIVAVLVLFQIGWMILWLGNVVRRTIRMRT